METKEAYLAEIRRYPLLTRDEEHALALRFAETRDPALGHQLVNANLRLVVKLAHQYSRAHENLLDLIQEGNVGLVHAVERFEPKRNLKLSTYATWWIRAYVLRYLLQNARLVRLGTTLAQRKLFFNLRKEQAKLARLGIDPSSLAVARVLKLPEREVVEMEQRLGHADLSLDAPLDASDPDRSRIETLESPASGRPDRLVEGRELDLRLRQRLAQFGRTLDGRDLIVFRERVLADEPKTLVEIGRSFGVSRERARQIERDLRHRLIRYLRAELGDAVTLRRAA